MATITINEALTSFGLSQKETKIYLASLELGTSTANNIANKAKINRSTTYDILKDFQEKGLASKRTIGHTANFEVVGPKQLLAKLDEKKHKLKAVQDQLELIQKRTANKPTVQVFQGHEGVKTILEDILNAQKPIDVISSSKIFTVFKYYFPHYIAKRKKIKIKTRVLQEPSIQTRALKRKDSSELRKTRTLKNCDLNTVTFIYSNKVAQIKLNKDDLMATLTTDNTIAKDQRQLFEFLWRKSR